MRYLLKLTYDGTAYHGWQIQTNAVSVQGELQSVLTEILDKPIETVGCGRTDTGVHASMYFAQFDAEDELGDRFMLRANFMLPADIRLLTIQQVPETFNARFDARSRSYEYILNFVSNPFTYKYSLLLYNQPNFQLMNEAASILLNHSTFTSFSKSGSDQKTDRCKITIAEWRPYQDGIWKFHISADRFLRGMVRAIVGTLLDVGYGKISIENFNEIIESKDRTKAGASVAAHALFLCDIQYPTHKLTL